MQGGRYRDNVTLDASHQGGPGAPRGGIGQGNRCVSFREGLVNSAVGRSRVAAPTEGGVSSLGRDRRVHCPSNETGKAYTPPGDLPKQRPSYISSISDPVLPNFRWSTLVDSDPTYSWKPKAFQEMGIRIRKWRPERVFGMQGRRYKVSKTTGRGGVVADTPLDGQGPARVVARDKGCPDRRGAGVYATDGCIALPARLERPTCRRETFPSTPFQPMKCFQS